MLDRVNRAAGALYSIDITDRRYLRGAKLARDGEQVQGRIVGIERKLEGSPGTDTELFALEIGRTGEKGPAGARIRAPRMERLRLGMPVLLRVDADKGRAVLDWPAMCARWGVEVEEPGQRLLRSAPEPGVTDTALDSGVQKHLKRWTPGRGTILGMEQHSVLGMTTQNWTVELELADGSHATASKEVIPFYACWLARPDAEVPVVVDPEDPLNASVDWPAAANEAADRAGGLDDAPPPGSAAEVIDDARSIPPAQAMTTTPEPEADPDVDPIEGVSLETWAAVEVGIGRDRVAPADHDAYAQGHGVPAGRWQAVHAAWQGRMMGDWRVGAKIGEALEAAKKRR